MSIRKAFIYAGIAAIVGALTQVLQIALAASLSPIESPTKWAISAGAGVIAGAVTAALPWIKAVLPTPPA